MYKYTEVALKGVSRLVAALGLSGALLGLPQYGIAQAKAAQGAAPQAEYLGATNRASESRGVVALQDPVSGKPLIAALVLDNLELEGRRASLSGLGQSGRRTSLLLIDAQSGESKQYWFPQQDVANGQAFHLLRSADGNIYTTIGQEGSGQFVEFDVAKREWGFSAPTGGIAMSFTQAPNGLIYYANYPDSMLYEFDPKTRKHRAVVRMDDVEMYPTTLAADDEGWVYAGIGTARSNIVGVHPASGKRRALLLEADRLLASGEVYRGEDGAVYARASRTIKDARENPWYRLSAGKAQKLVPFAQPILAAPSNIHFYHTLADFPEGGRIEAFLMPERHASITDAKGNQHTLSFDYESEGAFNTSVVAGTDGMIYGTSNHPNWVFRFNPQSGEFTDLGSLYGGLMTNMVAWGKYITGATYPSGILYLYDTELPWRPAPRKIRLADDDMRKALGMPSKAVAPKAQPGELNPVVKASFREITRPRSTILLADGHTLGIGGFTGYGHSSGHMAFYDLNDNKRQLWSFAQTLPGHAPNVMRQMEDGLIAVGTTTEIGAGGHRLSERAVVFLFDHKTMTAHPPLELPIAGVYALAQLDGSQLLVFAADGGSGRAFVVDMQKRKILKSYNLKEEGTPLNNGRSLLTDPETGNIYALLPHAISLVRKDGTLQRLHEPERTITSGAAILNGDLYFVCGQQLARLKVTAED